MSCFLNRFIRHFISELIAKKRFEYIGFFFKRFVKINVHVLCDDLWLQD